MSKGLDVQDQLEIAREKFIAGDYETTEALLSQILLKDARIPEVFQMLATIYYDRGQFNKAIKTFQRALEIDPGYTDASVGLSIIYNDLGRYEEGRQVFLEAQMILDKRKKNQDPWLNEKLASKHEEMAEMYFQQKLWQDALDNLQRALKLSSRKVELGMKIVECHIRLNELDSAAFELKNIINQFPQFLPARTKLAQVFVQMGRVKEGAEQYENILLRDPHNENALSQLKQLKRMNLDLGI